MRRRLAALAAAGAIATAGLLGVSAGPAAADPPGSWLLMGWYPTYASCVQGAASYAPTHGTVYICEQTGTWYRLWMH